MLRKEKASQKQWPLFLLAWHRWRMFLASSFPCPLRNYRSPVGEFCYQQRLAKQCGIHARPTLVGGRWL